MTSDVPPDDRVNDVLIVGGGTSGSVLAARLAQSGRQVLVLEAGRDVRSADDLPAGLRRSTAAEALARDPGVLWQYDAKLGSGDRRSRQVRGRVLGGSSSVNGSNFMRGLPEDYDGWGSPIWDWARVLPAFRRLERDLDFGGDLHGDRGPIPVWRVDPDRYTGLHAAFAGGAIEAGHAHKADLNDPVGDGLGSQPRNDPDGRRTSTAWAYLGPVRDQPNLQVRCGVRVLRVLFRNDHAIGVEAIEDGGPVVFRASEVVLSAGAIESPHLLLLSGVGPSADLRRAGVPVVVDLPGIGSRLACQPNVSVPLRVVDDEPGEDATRLQVCLVVSDADGARNDLSLIPRHLDGRDWIQCSLRRPASRGAIRLRSAEPDVPPDIDYGYLADADRRRLLALVDRAIEIADRPAMARFQIDAPRGELRTDAWLTDHLATPFHACGTIGMGAPDDPDAVVDDHGRVRGLAGLRVVDVSIMPGSVRAGPAATAVMIGERIAELYEEDSR